MANTVIQLKWSDVTSAPATLNVGEAAYSNTSQKLFIGDTSNNVLTIGGKFYVDQQGLIFTKTNVAFDAANSAGSYANAAFASSNNNAGVAAAGSYANSAFGTANSAASYANSAFLTANNSAGVNLTQNTNITNAGTYANSAFAAANTADTKAVNSGTYANSAFAAANTADAKGTSAGAYANSSFAVANAASSYANSAYTRANNSINANTGGTITGSLTISGGNLSVTGNLIVSGNTITQNVSSLNIADPLIYLAANNYTSDVVEIGFAANYYDGATQRHTGVFREASNKEFYVFDNYDKEPDANLIDINDASFRVATLNANVKSTTVTIKGIDLLPYVNNAYTAANTADAKGTSAGSYANSGFAVANSAASYANSAFLSANNSAGVNLTQNTNITNAGTYANSAFAAANTADAKGTSAGSYANSAFAVANNGVGIDATQNTNITNAGTYANAAFAKANTDFTNISITGADYGTASSVPAFRVEANGRISSANSTAIAIAASAITSGTLGVARGGTGAATFTTNGVLLGQGTSAFTTASSSTEGHLLTINASGVPTFSHLQGGTF